MIINNGLNQINQLSDIISMINDYGLTDVDPETIAANYAVEAAMDYGTVYYIEDEDLEYHLLYLMDHGAKFDFEKALKKASTIKMQYRNNEDD